MSRLGLILLATALVTPLAACETTYIIDGHVTVEAALAPTAPANLIVLITESQTELPDWSALDASADSGDAHAFTPGTLAYAYRYEQFGTSPHAIYLGAFVDVNGDGHLGSGEPYGDFAGNPILDAASGTTAAPTTAEIAIDQLAP